MAELFGVTVPNISYHFKRIFLSGELEPQTVIKEILITAQNAVSEQKYEGTILGTTIFPHCERVADLLFLLDFIILNLSMLTLKELPQREILTWNIVIQVLSLDCQEHLVLLNARDINSAI